MCYPSLVIACTKDEAEPSRVRVQPVKRWVVQAPGTRSLEGFVVSGLSGRKVAQLTGQKSPAPRKDYRACKTNRCVPALVKGLAYERFERDNGLRRRSDKLTRQTHLVDFRQKILNQWRGGYMSPGLAIHRNAIKNIAKTGENNEHSRRPYNNL